MRPVPLSFPFGARNRSHGGEGRRRRLKGLEEGDSPATTAAGQERPPLRGWRGVCAHVLWYTEERKKRSSKREREGACVRVREKERDRAIYKGNSRKKDRRPLGERERDREREVERKQVKKKRGSQRKGATGRTDTHPQRDRQTSARVCASHLRLSEGIKEIRGEGKGGPFSSPSSYAKPDTHTMHMCALSLWLWLSLVRASPQSYTPAWGPSRLSKLDA